MVIKSWLGHGRNTQFLPQKHGDLGREWTDIAMVLRISGMQGYGHHLCDVG